MQDERRGRGGPQPQGPPLHRLPQRLGRHPEVRPDLVRRQLHQLEDPALQYPHHHRHGPVRPAQRGRGHRRLLRPRPRGGAVRPLGAERHLPGAVLHPLGQQRQHRHRALDVPRFGRADPGRHPAALPLHPLSLLRRVRGQPDRRAHHAPPGLRVPGRPRRLRRELRVHVRPRHPGGQRPGAGRQDLEGLPARRLQVV